MIICACPAGNHSNRLFQNIHFEAFAMEYGIKYVNPSFNDMYHLYGLQPELSYTTWHKLASQITRSRIIRPVLRFDIESPQNEKILLERAQRKNVLVGGWGFRVHHLTEKFQSQLAKRYRLSSNLWENSELNDWATEKKKAGYILAGIHIRRGDYKEWLGGAYYFEDNVYKRYLDELMALPEMSGKKVAVVIFSNVDTTFEGTNTLFVSREPWYIDQHVMSMCDYLVGPPSTFTMWASYIGSPKYCHIDGKKPLSANEFKVCLG